MSTRQGSRKKYKANHPEEMQKRKNEKEIEKRKKWMKEKPTPHTFQFTMILFQYF